MWALGPHYSRNPPFKDAHCCKDASSLQERDGPCKSSSRPWGARGEVSRSLSRCGAEIPSPDSFGFSGGGKQCFQESWNILLQDDFYLHHVNSHSKSIHSKTLIIFNNFNCSIKTNFWTFNL